MALFPKHLYLPIRALIKCKAKCLPEPHLQMCTRPSRNYQRRLKMQQDDSMTAGWLYKHYLSHSTLFIISFPGGFLALNWFAIHSPHRKKYLIFFFIFSETNRQGVLLENGRRCFWNTSPAARNPVWTPLLIRVLGDETHPPTPVPGETLCNVKGNTLRAESGGAASGLQHIIPGCPGNAHQEPHVEAVPGKPCPITKTLYDNKGFL